MNNKIVTFASGAVLATSLFAAGTAFAQTPSNMQAHMQGGQGTRISWNGHTTVGTGANGGVRMAPGVFGTVSAINGATLTLTSKGFGPNASSTSPKTYTVDASSATVFKNGATSTLSSVTVGDTVMAMGTVSGTSVTATTIRDGMGMMAKGMGGMKGMHASSTPSMMQGTAPQKGMGGMLGSIGGFFHHLFSFL